MRTQTTISRRVLHREICSSQRYRPLESDIKEGEIFCLGFYRFKRRFYSLCEATHFQRVLLLASVIKNVQSGFGLSAHRLSRFLLGGDTLINRLRRGLTVEMRLANKTRQRFVSRVTRLDEQGSIHHAMIAGYVGRWKQWASGGLAEFTKQIT